MTLKFTEEKLELAITELLSQQGYPHVLGNTLSRAPHEVLIQADLRQYLKAQYATDHITNGEINSIIRQLQQLPTADLYDSNKAIMKMVSDGFLLKREDRSQKDLYVQLIDYQGLAEMRIPAKETLISVGDRPGTYPTSANRYKFVTQLTIQGQEDRIPDGIFYINGLPLVVFEFKSAIRPEATVHSAYTQLTTRYQRDIPELFKYNAFCIISDGINNKMGSFFAPYEFFYAWRKITGHESVEKDGIDSLFTLIKGLFDRDRLREVIRHFIYLPDKSHKAEKIVCRYPQYYAATKLYENIWQHRKRFDSQGNIISDTKGDGKGGTYFGATGCGKSYTMLFLTRLLMKSVDFESPTIVLISDRTDLDDQLSTQFTNAKTYIGDSTVISVESRDDLRTRLKDRTSGGVFLTTIHKFTEDTELLSDRTNIICISDEAHRSQINLKQKVQLTETTVKRTYGFAKYLHDSLPNATYVGFTGTPVDATLDVFGPVIDSYTMTESVQDEITVRIVYEGRAAKVILDNSKLQAIEAYYQQSAAAGASDYQIDESKRATAKMGAILGDPDRIRVIAQDFVTHYENRVAEGATQKGKALFVCSDRTVAYQLYQAIVALRPEWAEVKACEENAPLTDPAQKEIKPMAKLNLVMTRSKDDDEDLYALLGSKEARKERDRQFKNSLSNFKIAIVVDMWLTGFDVPFLDTLYLDKPIARHNLIQTISRVNRKYKTKDKGLIVDYIGIKKQMNLALAHYSKADSQNIEGIHKSLDAVTDHLHLLGNIFHPFNTAPYFSGTPLQQLQCLNEAAEFVQATHQLESRFMQLVKRLKAAYDICCGSEALSEADKDYIHFYLAVRSIIFKLTKGNAPDTAQMNLRVREMIKEALASDGVEEIFQLGEGPEVDIFDDDYLAKIEKIKFPNTKIKLLQQMLAKAIAEFKKVNKAKGVDFSKKFQALVERYNERDEDNILVGSVLEDFSNEIIELIDELKTEKNSFTTLGIDFEEKAFYDILKSLTAKYDFRYPDDKMIALAKAVKGVVEDKARYTDWSDRADIKADLQVGLIMLLDEYGYPPVTHDEVYKEVLEQAENYKKNQAQSLSR